MQKKNFLQSRHKILLLFIFKKNLSIMINRNFIDAASITEKLKMYKKINVICISFYKNPNIFNFDICHIDWY